MIKKLIFIFSIFCWLAPAWGLTLKIKRTDSDTLDIPLHTAKRTEHSLAVKMADGSIYYADMEPVAQSFPGGVFARIDSQVYQIGPTSKFFVTTTPDTDSFSFKISAKGNFTIVWGDGAVQEIVRTDTTATLYSHTYSTAGAYTIGIGGQATGYSTDPEVAAITFFSNHNQNVSGIRGSLGAIFSTIGDGSGAGQQPSFSTLFSWAINLSGQIPEDLFTGVHGQPVDYMFGHIFYQCNHLTGQIPEKLFAGIQGAPTNELFRAIFAGCSQLTGSIPEKLFAGISGPAKHWMFAWSFLDCPGLTGPSARINGKYLYEIWPGTSLQEGYGCYAGTTAGLSDYNEIPDTWK